MLNKIWRKMSGEKIENFSCEVDKAISNGQKVLHIGCDSQQHERITEFVTVVVLLHPGKGGRVLYTKDKVPRINSLRERLLTEVSKSIELAFVLNTIISEDTELCVHVDVNPNLKFKSSKYLQELVGYVMGQGFTCLTKPESWAAMSVADHICKHKNIKEDIRIG